MKQIDHVAKGPSINDFTSKSACRIRIPYIYFCLVNACNLTGHTEERKFSMAPIIDRQLSRQKIRQRISVFVVFKTKSV